ncbi:MAG: hypothetical protein LBG04_04210 [Holosporaceae bacterium]|jgi:hypothetical protein|nr:hypothetical protein [Holosporaceae bacterium]
MKILIEAKKNYIVTTAIGYNYYNDWYRYAYPTWRKYCDRFGIGLIVFEKNLIDENDPHFKCGAWQKLLIGNEIVSKKLDIVNVCHLDTDILISPIAPNIFDYYDNNNFAAVSSIYNIPYDDMYAKRIMSFHRHYDYEDNYPLDSSVFMSLENLWKYYRLPFQKDYFCSGVFVFNVKSHEGLLKEWFYKYSSDALGGYEEVNLNYEIQNYGNVQWLDYRFQALWVFEVPYKYPFLYSRRKNKSLIRECIEASLMINYFLHFAGSWHECQVWKQVKILNKKKLLEIENFVKYLNTPVTGEPKGRIAPKK